MRLACNGFEHNESSSPLKAEPTTLVLKAPHVSLASQQLVAWHYRHVGIETSVVKAVFINVETIDQSKIMDEYNEFVQALSVIAHI